MHKVQKYFIQQCNRRIDNNDDDNNNNNNNNNKNNNDKNSSYNKIELKQSIIFMCLRLFLGLHF